jgi:hypothetical protein
MGHRLLLQTSCAATRLRVTMLSSKNSSRASAIRQSQKLLIEAEMRPTKTKRRMPRTVSAIVIGLIRNLLGLQTRHI